MTLKDKIFSYFGYHDAINDPNKDANNKGTLERFNEALAEDLDAEILPKFEQVLPNVVLSNLCQVEYIPLIEMGYGNSNLFVSGTMDIRRKIIRQILRYYEIKGSIFSFQLMFNLMGLNATITEYFIQYSLDSPTTFDSGGRRFDMNCPSCFNFDINLVQIDATTPDLTIDEIHGIFSIINFNMPINGILGNITYNGSPIIPPTGDLGDYNIDYNIDFF